MSVSELFAWQPPSDTYPNTLLLQKGIELVDDGCKMRSRFVPLGFELIAIGIKANKVFNTL